MTEFIGCDMHKKYSVFVSMNEAGQAQPAVRVEHADRQAFRQYLGTLTKGSAVAVETTGTWYWLVDELEAVGLRPQLTNARTAKLLMGCRYKTDKLDAKGLATLLRNGTLPTVWIATAEVRDLRELTRTRMALSGMRTKVKNRILADFAKYGIPLEGYSDVFGLGGRRLLGRSLEALPEHTRQAVEDQLMVLDAVCQRIKAIEPRIEEVIQETPMLALLRSLPGIGKILATVIGLEIGTIERFATAERLCSYSGVVPCVRSSGGRTRFAHTASDVNRYLKWAFVEAANLVVANRERWHHPSLRQLYERICRRKNHPVATMAVARQLAESAFWVLKKEQPYREPFPVRGSSSPR